MTALTMPRMAFSPVQTSAVEVRGQTWSRFFEAADPLATWKGNFAEWINDLKSFREFESAYFFPDTQNAVNARVHRGWLCSLVSMGEMLAVELLTKHSDEDSTHEQLGFVDTFLKNLQSTLDTWHAADHDPAENPFKATARA